MSENLYRDNLVSTATAVTVIDASARAQVPVILWSDPGVGKTSLIASMAEADAVPMEFLIGSQKEPSDIAGYPVVENGNVVMSLQPWARNLIHAGGGYLLLDELTTAAPAVRAAMLTVIQERRVDQHKLPDDTRIIAAANPPDRSAGGLELDAPTANRFLHLDFEPTQDEWLTGMRTGFNSNPASRAVSADPVRVADEVGMVTGFIEARSDLLHQFPATDEEAGRPWPSRRSWHSVTKVLSHLRTDDTDAIRAVVFGLVGKAVAVEYLSWRATMDLPSVADVLANPKGIEWKKMRPDQVWAILSAVIAYCTGQNNKTAWAQAWGPVVAAAEAGVPGVAGAAARSLSSAMPPGAVVPSAVRKLKELAVAAGLSKDDGSVDATSKVKSLAGESVA